MSTAWESFLVRLWFIFLYSTDVLLCIISNKLKVCSSDLELILVAEHIL